MNMQAEEGIKETRENHPARGLEEHAGSGGRGAKEKCQTMLCQLYNFPLIHMWICISTHVLQSRQEPDKKAWS